MCTEKVIKESFQDLLYKFILETKTKNKEETNSLPVLDD